MLGMGQILVLIAIEQGDLLLMGCPSEEAML